MAMAPDDLDLMQRVLAEDQDLAAFFEDQKNCSYYQFKPRPNQPEKWDEQEAFIKNKDMVSFLVGGNACLAPWSLIYDPIAGDHLPISERHRPFHVFGKNIDTGKPQIQEASIAFCKGTARLFLVHLVTGAEFTASAKHRVLTPDGWKKVSELRTGDFLSWLTDDIGQGRVEFIKEVVEGEIWDFTCLPDHNYLHAGVIHHNSGTTVAGCAKLANMVFKDSPPPRRNAPIWIISNTYEQVCGTIWDEKLYGQGFIPDVEIDWPNVKWLSRKDGWPMRVPLKPWPGSPGKNFVLEFRSFEQGRSAMQARSIFGAFFSEQFPLNIFLEVLRGHRDYHKPGRFFAEFTPIDPDLCLWLEKAMDSPPEGWRFYRCNTELNRQNLSPGWFEEFFATVSPEARETRMTGALATFEGVIYQGFNQAVHVVDSDKIEFPPGAKHYMGVDWGAGGESPFHVVWAYRDGAGCWVQYGEYRNKDQTKTVENHAATVTELCQGWGWPVTLSTHHMGELLINNRNSHYGVAFCDPSRPTDINLFAAHGVPSQPAMNAVLPGIECVRGLLQYNPGVKQPKLLISSDCKITIEEMRKYRWKQGTSPADGVRKNYSAPNPEPQKYDDHACFPRQTKVMMADGIEKPIHQVKVGEVVQTHLGAARVDAAGQTGVKHLVRVEFSDDSILYCTAEHQLRIAGGGWVAAADSTGMEIAKWKSGTMTSSEHARCAEKCSLETATSRRNIAPIDAFQGVCVRDVQPVDGDPVDVFCLATTDGTLVADGCLTLNCDALRYMIFSVERTHGATISSMTDNAYIDGKHSINLKRGGSRMASRVQMSKTQSGRDGGVSIGNRLNRQDGWFLKK